LSETVVPSRNLQEIMMTSPNTPRPISRLARTLVATAAVVASCGTLSAVVRLFDSAGSTPWFVADHVALFARCEPLRVPTQRHACLRAASTEAATTQVATR
jgi:hypothetical protein